MYDELELNSLVDYPVRNLGAVSYYGDRSIEWLMNSFHRYTIGRPYTWMYQTYVLHGLFVPWEKMYNPKLPGCRLPLETP